MLHVVFKPLNACLAKKAPALAKLGAGPDSPLASPSAILSTSRGFHQISLPFFCGQRFRLATRHFHPIALDRNTLMRTESTVPLSPLNRFRPSNPCSLSCQTNVFV